MAGILGCFCLIDTGQFAVCDGNAAVHHSIVHRGAQADRAEDVFRIIACADKLQPPRIDEDQVRALADCKAADVAAPEQGGGAARRELQHVVAARRNGRAMQAMEQIADADLLEQIGAVLRG